MQSRLDWLSSPTSAAQSPAPVSFAASLAFLTRGWVMPEATDLALMAACGVIAAVGLTLLTHAYRIAPSASVAPFVSAPADAVVTEVAGLKLKVVKSGHAKCARCWHHREDVGVNPEHPEICGRCVDNISGAGEVRHYA